MASGVTDELFWSCEPREVALLVKELGRRTAEVERKRSRETASMIAAIYNIRPWRKKGSRNLTARDFMREPARMLTAKQMESAFDAWAATANGGRTARA